MRVPSSVTRLVSVIHGSQHYAVLEIDIPRKRIVIFDGLYRDMLQWIHHVVSSLKRARLIGVDETCNTNDTGKFTSQGYAKLRCITTMATGARTFCEATRRLQLWTYCMHKDPRDVWVGYQV